MCGHLGEVCPSGNGTEPRIPGSQEGIGAKEFFLDFFTSPHGKIHSAARGWGAPRGE